jgi:hypothetical protein
VIELRRRKPAVRVASVTLSARSKQVGGASEMVLTDAEQVSDDGTWAAGLRRINAWSSSAGSDDDLTGPPQMD